MLTNFINFHVLISHSPSCLNRDDMDMQKSCVFGGKRRVRISSQSLKRAMRKSKYYGDNLGEASIRTKKLGDLKNLFVERLAGRFDAVVVTQAMTVISGKDMGVDVAVEGDAVAPWTVEEVAWYCEQINKYGNDEKKLAKQLKEATEAMRRALASGVDIALSGRMATSGLMSEMGKIDGALAVAHVITTHAIDSDIDWFAAVDDLQELGSGHLDTQEFSSGVFYRYASLNLNQLQENLGNASREKALEIAAHVLHMFATEVPTAKQHSFAAHNPADLAMVSFSDIPISLANAFEEPVKATSCGGYLKPSINELHNYWQKVHTGYAHNERCAEFALGTVEAPNGVKSFTSLEHLKAWVRSNGEG
jgi:CRISPR system Cascade subunit CasC